MNNKLFIPNKIRVGFQARGDTYTKMLAYVIYYDQKGVLRKEQSWQQWRDKNIEAKEFDNVPTEGFVLNKGVGGVRCSYGWNARQEYVRVYDPRNFEFEISVPNLLFILRECDCSRGKGLEGKFVYAWNGTTLVLVPASSQEYKESMGFTGLQGKSVKAKELIEGATYKTKKAEELIYIGKRKKYNVSFSNYYMERKTDHHKDPFFIFWDGKRFIFLKNTNQLACVANDGVAPNYAELAEKYDKSIYGSKPVELFLKKSKRKYPTEWAVPSGNGFIQYACSYHKGELERATRQAVVSLDKDSLVCDERNSYAEWNNPRSSRNLNSYPSWLRERNTMQKVEPTQDRLWVKLESGATYMVNGRYLIEESPTAQETQEENDDGEY